MCHCLCLLFVKVLFISIICMRLLLDICQDCNVSVLKDLQSCTRRNPTAIFILFCYVIHVRCWLEQVFTQLKEVVWMPCQPRITPVCYTCSSYWSDYMGNKSVKIFLHLSSDCLKNLGIHFIKYNLLHKCLQFFSWIDKYGNHLLTEFLHIWISVCVSIL